jgi:zeaxanthin glucosyltransferase
MFYMLPEPGHMNPSFPLAQALRARGHDVVYGSTLDFEDEVTRRGFGFVPFHRDVYPRGWSAAFAHLPADEKRARATRLSQARRTENFLSGRVEGWVRSIDPDLILSDVVTYHMTLVAHRLELPCIRLSTSLSQRLDELPPLTSSLPPDTPPIQLAAARHRAAIFSASAEGGWMGDVYCSRFAYPARQASYAAVFCPDLALYREVLLCASAFDFPRCHGAAPDYLAAPLELERAESVPPALATFLDGNRPLIFISLGSQAGALRRGPAVLTAVLSALKERPCWQGVIAMGALDRERFWPGAPPPNVAFLSHAPQLWLLRRAAVFVTHGGLGSIREAIALEVPMLAIPQLNDGFGNAARVAYHGLGVHLPAPAADVESVLRCVDELLADAPKFKARLAQLNARCRNEELEARGPQLIEALGPRSCTRELIESTGGTGATARGGWLLVDAETKAVRGSSLRAATTQRDESAPASLGSSGFWICPTPGGALACAEGSVLARVELADPAVEQDGYLVGQVLTCRWLVDIAPVLRQYAHWCARQSLRSEPSLGAAAVEWCERMLASWTAPSPSIDGTAQVARWQRVTEDARAVCERADLILSDATLPTAWDAARYSRWRAVRTLALRAVGKEAGTSAGADVYVRVQRDMEGRFDAELARRMLAWMNEQNAVEPSAPGILELERTALVHCLADVLADREPKQALSREPP